MRPFLSHLWKEWREHRAVLLGIAVAIPFLLAVGCAATNELAYGLDLALPWVVAAGAALATLAVATEAWAGEARGDGLRFLRRTPGSIGAAFLAKTALLVLAGGAAAAWAALACLGAAKAFGSSTTADEVLRALRTPDASWLPAGAVVGVGFWAVMASTWVPRGAAAVALGVLLLGSLVAPAAWVVHRHEGVPLGAELAWVALALAVVAPLAATRVSLGRALARGLGHGRAAVLGMAVVLLVAVPGYAFGALRLGDWLDLDPEDQDFVILSAAVGEGGRYAFLTVNRGEPWEAANDRQSPTLRPWIVDLEYGGWREIGDLGEFAGVDGSLTANGSVLPVVGLVAVRSADGDPGSVAWWDAATGTRWRTLPADFRPPELVERLRDDLRRAAVVRRPDGSRAWALHDHIEWDVLGSGLASVALGGVRTRWPAKSGWSGHRPTSRRGEWENVEIGFDAAGSVRVEASPPVDPRRRKVRLSLHLVLDGPPTRRSPGSGEGWTLEAKGADPRPVRALRSDDLVAEALGPDTVLALRAPDPARGGTPWIVDVASDEARPCTLPPGLAAERILSVQVVAWSPSGEAVLRIGTVGGGYGLALLSPKTGRVRSWIRGVGTAGVACLDADTAIAWVRGSLLRIDWRAGSSRRVFPRE